MFAINWMALGAVGFGAIGTTLVLWAVIRASVDRDLKDAMSGDEFTPSMERFGYVQDARNRGEI